MLPTTPPKRWNIELQHSWCSNFSRNNKREISYLNLAFTCWFFFKKSLIFFFLKSEPQRNISKHFTSSCSVPVDDLQTLVMRKCSTPGQNFIFCSFLSLLCFSQFEISTLWRGLNSRNHCMQKTPTTFVCFTPLPQILPLQKHCLLSALLILGYDVCHHIPKIHMGVEWRCLVWGCAVQRKENSLPEINPLWDVCCWEVLIWKSRFWHGEGSANLGSVLGPVTATGSHYWGKWPEKLLGMVLNLFKLFIL